MVDEERDPQIEEEDFEEEEEYSPEAEKRRQIYLLVGLGALLIGIVIFQVYRLQQFMDEQQHEEAMLYELARLRRPMWIQPDEQAILTGFQILDQPQPFSPQ